MEGANSQVVAKKKSDWLWLVILLLFVGSGFSSLIYQVVWTRLLSLVLGSTTLAVATVLAVFMGGLCLGSYGCGKLAHTVKRSLFYYGVLEALIGIWAVFLPFLFLAANPIYRWVWENYHLSFVQFSCLRALIAAVILLLPTAMMGATLPLLSAYVVNNLRHAASRIGSLYAANTLGAVAGVAASGFLLLPLWGRQATTWVAVAVNLVLAVVALRLSGKGSDKADASTGEDALPATGVSLPWCLTAFAFSGAVAMIYEVGWTRTLLTVIGSTTYAFSCMLLSFLLGIFIGSGICTRFIDRVKQPLLWFAALEFVLCVLGLGAMYLFNYLPYWNIALNLHFPFDPNLALGVRFLLSCGIMLPIAICLGAIFPIVIKACVNDLKWTGRIVGDVYSANTLGAIFGAILAGFVFIPQWGTEKMLILASAGNIILGLMILYSSPAIKSEVKTAATIVGLIFFAWCVQIPHIWDRQIMLLVQHERRKLTYPGVSYVLPDFRKWQQTLRDSCSVLFWKDGASSAVGVVQFFQPKIRSLVTNGHMDGSDAADVPANVLLAAYPLLFKPDAKDVGVVGWGTGCLTSTVLKFPVKSVDVIEIEPAVVQTAALFHHVNAGCERDPRVHFEMNDGRNFLQASNKQYDVLISEPSNPWQAGVCNLFTAEYFDICRRRLKPDGIFSLWLQTHEIPPENLQGILAALRKVFPYEVGLMINSTNVCVLASSQPLVADYEKIQACLNEPQIAKALSVVNLDSASNMLARIGFTEQSIDLLTRNVAPNIDDTNKLEYAVGRSYENRAFNDENRQNFVKHMTPVGNVVSFGNVDRRQKALLMAEVAKQTVEVSRPAKATVAWVQESLSTQTNAEALIAMGMLAATDGHLRLAEEYFRKALTLDPDNLNSLIARGKFHLQLQQLQAAENDFLRAYAIDSNSVMPRYYLAQLAVLRPMGAATQAEALEKQAKLVLKYLGSLPETQNFVLQHHDVLSLAALACINTGQDEKAEKYLRQYLQLEPKSIMNCSRLSKLLLRQKRIEEAREWMQRVEDLQEEKFENP